MTLITIAIITFAIHFILNNSYLTRHLRAWVFAKNDKIEPFGDNYQHPLIAKLYECVFCLSFEAGWMILAYLDFPLSLHEILVIIGKSLIVATLAYFLHLVEEVLVRKTL